MELPKDQINPCNMLNSVDATWGCSVNVGLLPIITITSTITA